MNSQWKMLEIHANLIKLDNVHFDLCSNSFKLISHELRLVVATTTKTNRTEWIGYCCEAVWVHRPIKVLIIIFVIQNQEKHFVCEHLQSEIWLNGVQLLCSMWYHAWDHYERLTLVVTILSIQSIFWIENSIVL